MQGCNTSYINSPLSFQGHSELLQVTLSFLPVTEIAKARLVCQDWNRLGQSPLLLQKKIDQCQSETDPKKINDVILMLLFKRTTPQNDSLIIDLSARSRHLWIENYFNKAGVAGMRPIDYVVETLAAIHELPENPTKFYLGLFCRNKVKAISHESHSTDDFTKLLDGLEQFLFGNEEYRVQGHYVTSTDDSQELASLQLLNEASAEGSLYAFYMALFAKDYYDLPIDKSDIESLVEKAKTDSQAQRLLLRLLKKGSNPNQETSFLLKKLASEIPTLIEKLAKAGELKFQVEHTRVLITQKRTEEALFWLKQARSANYLPAFFLQGRLCNPEQGLKMIMAIKTSLNERQLAFYLGIKSKEGNLSKKQKKLLSEYQDILVNNDTLLGKISYYELLSKLYKPNFLNDLGLSEKYKALSNELSELKKQYVQKARDQYHDQV